MDKKTESTHNANPLGTTRRIIWYALRTVLVISVILALCYGVFTEAMYISNMYIVATEGMSLRAEAILTSASVSDLEQYFTEEQLDGDYMLYAGTYGDYTIENYDYRFQIKGIRVLPWSKSGTITYVERIPTITGSADFESETPAYPPAWTPVCYAIRLNKVEGRWLISGLTVLEENPEEEVLPTPDYSQLEN